MAAPLSGEADFIQDVPVRDLQRVADHCATDKSAPGAGKPVLVEADPVPESLRAQRQDSLGCIRHRAEKFLRASIWTSIS